MADREEGASAFDKAEEEFLSLPEVEAARPESDAGDGAPGEGGEEQAAAPPGWWQGRSQEEVDRELKERFLDAPIPATADYPVYLHGRPMKDLIRAQFLASQKITEQGQTNAELNDKLRVYDTMQQVLLRQLGGAQPGPAPGPAAPAAPATAKGLFAKYGIDPMKEFLADPAEFFEKFFEVSRREMEEGIDGRVRPLEDTAAEVRNRNELLGIRNASDQARDYIMQERGITDPNARQQFVDSWDRRKQFMAQHAGGHAATPFNPRSWYDAHVFLESQVGGFAPTMPAIVPRGENASGAGNPPSSARSQSMGNGQRGRASKATARQKSILNDLLKDSGIDGSSESVRRFREEVEDELGGAVERGIYHA